MSILRTGSGRAGTRLDPRGWARSLWRPGPERWIWPVSLAGWAVLLWGAIGWYPIGARFSPALSHDHAVVPLGTDVGDAAAPGVGIVPAAAAHLLLWAAMVAATMLPLIAPNLRTVGMRSPRDRRRVATLEVSEGWALVWLATGVITALAVAASMFLAVWTTVAVVCAATVAWRFTRVPLSRRT